MKATTVIHLARAARTLLATLLLALLTATTATAQDAISGLTYNSTGGYYAISDAQDLVDLATYVNSGNNASGKTFKQTQDIDLSSAGNFEPIGSQPNSYTPTPFNGTYDGQGHAIIGLTVNSTSPQVGLFGELGGGTVSNLTMVNPNVKSSYSGDYTRAGGIVGHLRPGTIENCNVINPTLNAQYKGAICGCINLGGSAVNDCYFYTTGSVNAVGLNGLNQSVTGGRTYTMTLGDGVTTSTKPTFSYGGTDYYNGTITLAKAPIGWVYPYSVNGSAIDGNTFNITDNSTVSLGEVHISSLLGYDEDPLVDGSAEHPYIISTTEGWNLFCDCLNDNDTWNRFSGKTVKLGDDITVSRMAGSSYHDFCGTFDGQGNTLTVNISSDDITDGSTQYVAPFRYVTSGDSPATIRNLHVTGTITTAKQFTGGLIGGCWGTVIVENCRVSTAITSTISGDGTHGGIVGIQQNGSLYIRGTVFDGSLLGATTHAVGGFLGWRKSGAEIRNSLFAPAEVTVLNTSGATFARNKVDTYNSYYTYYLCDGTNYAPYDPADADHPDKYNNGHMRRTITAGENVTIDAIALTGDATEYTVSGIVAYSSGGLYRDGNLYYGSGDQLSLTLSNSVAGAPLGYQYGYTASAGTLSGTTLTMPDADVTISVNTAALALIDWATVSDGDSEATAYMIYNKDQLLLLAHRVNGTNGETANDYAGKYFKLGADITFDHPDNETDDYAENYEAIGNEDRFFCGNFDGANHTVSGIRIRKTGSDAANSNLGLFGCIAPGANIHDVHLTDARITGNCCVGGIVGFNGDGYISGCSVTDSYITAVGEYGTICGENSNATLTNNYYHGCTVNGTENATNVGCFILADIADNTDIAANNGALPAYAITLGDGVSYYREGLALPLASTLGSEVSEGYTLSFSANGTALSGNTYTVNTTDGDVTITAAIRSDGLQHEVSYVDADGTTQTAQAIALDGYETTLAAGWYFVGKDIDYTATITLGGDVNLILADGCTMNIGSNDNKINDYGIKGYINKSNKFDLTIYGQSLGTGDLNVYTTGNDYHHAIFVRNLTINGGNVTAITNDSKASALYATSDLTINGGNVTATGTGYSSGNGIFGVNSVTINGGIVTASSNCYGISGNSVTINGGIVTANGSYDGIYGDGVVTINGGIVTANGIYASDGTLTLGWTRPDDRITASRIRTIDGSTVAVADGQALTDGRGNIYTGTLTDDEISAIAGKTLQPCISYLDSDGKTQYCADYTVLTGNETELDNTDGWYVATGTLNYDHTLILSADVNLILADGCQMNFGTSESRLDCYGINYTGYPTLNIYGQSTGNDMGTLSAYTTGNETHAIRASYLRINGGNVVANANGDDANGLDVYDDLIVNDGNVIATATGYSATAISTEYNLHVNGGNVTATVNGESAFAICVAMNKFEVTGGKVMVTVTGDNATAICHHTEYRSLFAGGTITVTGANDNGNIYLNGATVTFSSYGGYMEVGEGLFYTDGEGNYYYGELTSSEISAIAGKTLSPSSSPAISLADTEQNQKLLALDGATLDVTLANRTIDTEWNTIALPFGVTYWQLIETFGKGVKLYELTGSTLEDGVLGLEFTSATSIEVGKPYFIKASADVVNPTFHDVTIDAWANNPSWTDYVDFIPTLGVTKVEGSDLREVLVLGAGNTLYNPAELPAMMKGFRGYFRVHDEVVANAAQFRMSFAEESEISGIFRVAGDNGTDGCIYNLMGQKVNRAEKGLFIVKGKKMIVR